MDACFADDGHEIGIAEPAREDVEMDMADDSGAARATDVHAEVHAVGLVVGAKGAFNALREMHHFGEGFGIGAGEIADVSVGDDHDVAGGVGVAIEDDEDFLAAIDDQGVVSSVRLAASQKIHSGRLLLSACFMYW